MRVLCCLPDPHPARGALPRRGVLARLQKARMMTALDAFFEGEGVDFDFYVGTDPRAALALARSGGHQGGLSLFEIQGGGDREAALKEFCEALPVVSFFKGCKDGAIAHVELDHQKAIEVIVEHLFREGHRRLSYLGPPEEGNRTAGIRRSGFRKALLARGLSASGAGVLSIANANLHSGRYLDEPMRRALDRWFQLQEVRPEAVVCFNDEFALAVMEWAALSGLGVPRDLAVTGIDGSFLEHPVHRDLTTVRVDLSSMARRAAALLLSRIRRSGLAGPRRVLLEPELRIGTTSLKRSLAGGNQAVAFVEQVRRFTAEHLALPDPAAAVAERAGLSRSHFRRKFLAWSGRSFRSVLLEMRLAEVARLLRDSDQAVHRLAEEAGFRNLSQFNRAFRARFGCAPSEKRVARRVGP